MPRTSKSITIKINKGPFAVIVATFVVLIAITITVLTSSNTTNHLLSAQKASLGSSKQHSLSITTKSSTKEPAATNHTSTDNRQITASSQASSGSSGALSSANTYHVQNPFAGASWFVDPAYVKQVHSSYEIALKTNPTLAGEMESVATYPTAIWLDSVNAIYGTNGSDSGYSLKSLLNDALAEETTSTHPEVIELVIYDMPGRDCAALASNGTIPLSSSGLVTYENKFINPIYNIISQPKYSHLRIVTVIEPDSLPNLVTNLSSSKQCALAASSGIYESAIEYDLNKFSQLSYVYNYLDIGHSAWLGWSSNMGPAVTLYTKVVKSTTKGFSSINGFITDTANYVPVKEPYMTATEQIGGQSVDSATFYQYDPDIDESDYAANLYSNFVQAGWPTTIGFIIDTSRDGWGGPKRPKGPSLAGNVNTFVDQSKIDGRPYRGLWCNQAGAGMGYRPQADPKGYPSAHIQAFVWIKPPGQSDGAGKPIPNNQGKKFDPNCSSTYQENEYGYTGPSNALPNAPLAGEWFNAQFEQLVENAYPPIKPYKETLSPFKGLPHVYVPGNVTNTVSLKPVHKKSKVRVKSVPKVASGHKKTKIHSIKKSSPTPTRQNNVALTGEIPLCKGKVGIGYFHTFGNQILDSHNCPVRIAGVNWYGFETPDEIAHGLWAQSYQTILGEIKADGYNTIRIPYSDQMIQSPIIPQNLTFSSSTGAPINTALKGKNAFQDLVIIVDYATGIGLKVILDQHRSKAGESASSNGLWYDSIYSTKDWINDWVLLAKTFKGNTGVIGADLHNEPHTPSGMNYTQGATWGTGGKNDWRLAAEQAGDAILKVNPRWLIFVEGIGENPTNNPADIPVGEKTSGDMNATWWGGDLELVQKYPVTLSVAHRLVYSAHEYGPVEYQQTWFNSSTTYKTLESVWYKEWGYIYLDKIAPVWIGEFGTGNTNTDISSTTPGSQGQWFSDLIEYLRQNPFISWTYWAANGEDSYALLNSNYSGIDNPTKQSLLESIQFPFAASPNTHTTNPVPPTKKTTAVAGTSKKRKSSQPPSTVSGSTTTQPSTTPTLNKVSAASSGSGSCSATITILSRWSNQGTWGFTASVSVQAKTQNLSSWQVNFTLPAGEKITNSWNATLSGNSGTISAANATYNGNISAGASTSFGFQASGSSNNLLPSGVSCS